MMLRSRSLKNLKKMTRTNLMMTPMTKIWKRTKVMTMMMMTEKKTYLFDGNNAEGMQKPLRILLTLLTLIKEATIRDGPYRSKTLGSNSVDLN
jgi:hypothetical protein